MSKRALAFILAAFILLPVLVIAASSEVELPIIDLTPTKPAGRGDANGDGRVNAKDVTAIMRYMVGVREKVFYNVYADMDKNGTINARDVIMLMLGMVDGEFGD